MKKTLRLYLFSNIILFLLALVPARVFAIGSKNLGEQCESASECGINMGCRQSLVGAYKVCKIAVPGTSGCAIEKEEPLCGEEMICKKNRCVNDFGLEKTVSLKEKPSEIRKNSFFLFIKGTPPPIFSFFDDERFSKASRVILAVALLFGLTKILKGVLIYQNAIGLIPEQRRGIFKIALGGTFFVASIVLWYLFR